MRADNQQHRQMSIRQHVAALIVVAVLCLVGTLGAVAIGFWQAEQGADRIAAVERRFDVLSRLEAQASRYAAEVADALVGPRERLDGLQAARLDLERSFARLSQMTRSRISSAAGSGEIESQLPRLENARRMTELYHAIDRSAARALVLQRDGRPRDAVELFEREVSFRLSNELQPLIASDLGNERGQLQALSAAAAEGRRSALLAGGVVAAAGLGIVALLARGLFAAVRRNERGTEAARDELDKASAAAKERIAALEARSTQFLADVSHELRTPVTILRGEADVALRGGADASRLRGALERIQGQAEELGELLDDLISFARAQAEAPETVSGVVAVREVVEAAAQEGELLAEPREVTVVADFGDEGALIEADARRLKRALLIGIDNAVKHSPPGGGISIETGREGGSAVIRIIDAGPGVSADEKPLVFERFFRGAAEKELQNRGIGVGLPIAKEIVEQHGGSIALDNGADGGAVLTIVLPCTRGGSA